MADPGALKNKEASREECFSGSLCFNGFCLKTHPGGHNACKKGRYCKGDGGCQRLHSPKFKCSLGLICPGADTKCPLLHLKGNRTRASEYELRRARGAGASEKECIAAIQLIRRATQPVEGIALLLNSDPGQYPGQVGLIQGLTAIARGKIRTKIILEVLIKEFNVELVFGDPHKVVGLEWNPDISWEV